MPFIMIASNSNGAIFATFVVWGAGNQSAPTTDNVLKEEASSQRVWIIGVSPIISILFVLLVFIRNLP